MSLKTSLNAEAFAPPALEEPADSQPGQQEAPAQEKRHEEAVPYDRFQQVVHNNQQMQNQIAQYEARLQQLQMQQAAPQTGLGGMQQAPQPQSQQQQAQSFIDRLKDPEERKHWQNRLVKEGPAVFVELTNRVIEEQGGRMLQEAMGPILERLARVEGDRVNNAISQYANNVQDPEFGSYRPMFEALVRQASQNFDMTQPQNLDLVRNFAAAQFRSQYGYNQAYHAPPTPPVTERPQNAFGFANQQPVANSPFSSHDSEFASKFGLDPQAIAAARQRTTRSR